MSAATADELFDDEVLGDGATGVSTPHEPGLYKAIIVSGKPCEPSIHNPDKPRLVFEFGIEGETYPIRYWVNRSFGFSPAIGWASLAKLVSAATAIPLGDKKLSKVKLGEVIGQTVMVRTGLNKKGYAKILEVLPVVE